jgi:hypothetical protein
MTVIIPMKRETRKKNKVADQSMITGQINLGANVPEPAATGPMGEGTSIPVMQAENKTEPSVLPEPNAVLPSLSSVRSGRGVQFYLDDLDRKFISQLAFWFASQNRRVSDSQVIKAAVRYASQQTSPRLLQICDELLGADRRRTKKP